MANSESIACTRKTRMKTKSIRRENQGMTDRAAFQVIVLGPSGGPREDSISGLLVRSTSTEWSKGSVIAVDAGTLVAGIVRILEQYTPETKSGRGLMKEGPFIGLNLPNVTARANAAYVFREIIGAVLITHPHLDHLAGLAINTPIVEAGNGPKTVAALPSVISAIKNHMFNDVIWPNLSDEDGGAGLITYQRLVEGGNPRFGRGDAKGYVRVCEGLLTRCLGVSHGRCRQRYHPETGRHHRVGSAVFSSDPLILPSRARPGDHHDAGIFPSSRSPRLSVTSVNDTNWSTVESSAFFIRDTFTSSEMIVFGDIEPDSISLEPRNKRVWEIAASKLAAGSLRAIFIECSFNESVDDHSLYGHLCPRHLVAELNVLAAEVAYMQHPSNSRGRASKRKRHDSDSAGEAVGQLSPRTLRPFRHLAPKSRRADGSPSRGSTARSGTRSRPGSSDNNGEPPELVHDENTPGYPEPIDVGDDGPSADDPEAQDDIQWADSTRLPLAGLSVYVIHIKDTMTDGPPPREQILQELRARGEAAGLGCEFFVPKRGEGIWI